MIPLSCVGGAAQLPRAIPASSASAALALLPPAGRSDPSHAAIAACAIAHRTATRRRSQEKWSATKWIHVNAYGGTAAEQKAGWGDCVDANEDCGAWAKSGECKNNPGYMLVSCRKACGACKPKKGTPVIDVGAKT
jgi:hypothetical protein